MAKLKIISTENIKDIIRIVTDRVTSQASTWSFDKYETIPVLIRAMMIAIYPQIIIGFLPYLLVRNPDKKEKVTTIIPVTTVIQLASYLSPKQFQKIIVEQNIIAFIPIDINFK